MSRIVRFIEFKKKKKHKKKHKHHHDYCDCQTDGSGFEGRWMGEENGVTISADSEAECHKRLDDLRGFTK
jgi:hypothetical protein